MKELVEAGELEEMLKTEKQPIEERSILDTNSNKFRFIF